MAALRERLRLSGDLPREPAQHETPEWDPNRFHAALDRAVRRFQERHGLEVDGLVGSRTPGALNVPVAERIHQLRRNLERRRAFSMEERPIRVLVNIPAFLAYVLEEGKDPVAHRVVVGREAGPSPLLTGEMGHVVLAPYWNVPPGIPRRAFSSGCIRVEGAMELARRLVDPLPGWGPERVRTVAEEGEERWVPLPEPIPVHTVYWTAWVGSAGTLHLVEDLYGLDGGGGRVAGTPEETLSEYGPASPSG